MTAAHATPMTAHAPWLQHYPQGIDWAAPLTPSTVHAMLDATVAKLGSRRATNFLGKTLTYSEIGRLVDQAAAGLQKLGVKKGSKVGLFLPNSPTFIVFYYATLKAGGTVVNYNPLYTVEELAHQIKDSDTELMVTLDLKVLFEKVESLISTGVLKRAIVASFPALLPSAKSVLFKLFRGRELANVSGSKVKDKVLFEGDVLSGGGTFTPVAIDPMTDLAVLQYTGGTTGTPKGAMLTHANLSCNVQQSMHWTRPYTTPGTERVLAILPFFHVFAMTGIMNLGIAEGSELIILPRFVLDDAMKLIDKSKPTIMPGVPTIFGAIMNHKDAKKLDLRSLKICLSGGAPLPAEIKKGFESITGATLVEAYGLSETSPGATINPLDGRAKTGSIGQPIPGTTISIREVGAPEKEMPLGQSGEICIKGPQVMKGYYKKPQDTADVFIGDFFRTGDVGYMDAEGFIFIVDRIKDMIICSGFKVFPRHLEEKIYEHPAVEEVTVIGIKDKYRGEAPKAFIKLKAGMTATKDDIMKHLEPKLSKIELPAEIEFRAELPKTMIGKLSKKELKAEEAAKA
ncbi:MAG: long-chain fatty acid--CoA ligase [Hyphomicrobiaceae bacterium]|nr:long-chain fatty acid--CoA ligase [Hyphomicrobiaceae bacterium]